MPTQEEDALRGRIIGLLLSAPVLRIDFTLGSVRVEKSGFVDVAQALIKGTIHVRIGRVRADAAGRI
jgi:hypothetical protein